MKISKFFAVIFWGMTLAVMALIFMFSSATIVNSDKQGRVLVSPNLRTFANITKDVIIIGAGNHVEIWDKAAYEKQESEMDFADIEAAMEELEF